MAKPGTASAEKEEAWRTALRLDDLWEGEMTAVRVDDTDVLVVRLAGGQVRAFDNRCPHAGSPLNEGRLEAATLRCAAHLWEFDARTGEGKNPRGCRLRTYPVRTADGVVEVQVGEGG